MRRFSSRLIALLPLLIVGCPGTVKFRATAAYRPISSSWDSVEIRVRGSRVRDHDQGDECEGSLAVKTQGITRTLEVKWVASRTSVTTTTPPGLVKAGVELDPRSLLAAGPAITPAEAEDILKAFEGACLGPRIGFPPTPTLRVITEDSHYE
jgi:hypothetical protein